jgi:hypothetical protein
MATELGGAKLAAKLKQGDLLKLNDPHPQGGGKVFRATVVETGDANAVGRVGIVRTDQIEPASEPTDPGIRKVKTRLERAILLRRMLREHELILQQPLPDDVTWQRYLERANTFLQTEQEIHRFGVQMTPFVGTLVMVGEALVGRSIFGKPLSITERAILGAAAFLAEVGPLIRLGKMVLAADRLSTVVPALSRAEAFKLIMSSRVLTATEQAELRNLSEAIKAGRALTKNEEVIANRLLGKVTEPMHAAGIRSQLGPQIAGRFTNLSKKISADELRVGRALAKELGVDVVRPVESTVKGVKNADYILGTTHAELYTAKTNSLGNLIGEAVKKHKQAGVIIIDLTKSSVEPGDVVRNSAKIFSDAHDIDRIIVMQGTKIVGQAVRSADILPFVVKGLARDKEEERDENGKIRHR